MFFVILILIYILIYYDRVYIVKYDIFSLVISLTIITELYTEGLQKNFREDIYYSFITIISIVDSICNLVYYNNIKITIIIYSINHLLKYCLIVHSVNLVFIYFLLIIMFIILVISLKCDYVNKYGIFYTNRFILVLFCYFCLINYSFISIILSTGKINYSYFLLIILNLIIFYDNIISIIKPRFIITLIIPILYWISQFLLLATAKPLIPEEEPFRVYRSVK